MATTSWITRSLMLLCVCLLLTGCGGGGGGTGHNGQGEDIAVPVVTSQPGNQTVPLNVQAVFTVTASGKELSYQWERSDDDGATWSRIAGATSASYSFTPSSTMKAGFRCTVTNSAGSVASSAAGCAAVNVVFVDQNAQGGVSNGTSWENAYPSLQAALAAAAGSSEIWVAAGTYLPGTSRDDHFQMRHQVDLYGGFSGKETCREARNWKTNETVLSGEIGDPNSQWDNSLTVVWGVSGATIDGFTISRGYPFGTQNSYRAGGMMNFEQSPRVVNCTFSDNYGMYGGALYNDTCSATVINCSFTRNWGYWGSGIYNYASTAVVMGCSFSDNFADYYGSGIFNCGGGSVSVIGSSFANNINTALSSDSGALAVINCTFAGNDRAINCSTNSGLVLKNSILWGSGQPSGFPQLSYGGSTQSITDNCIEGGFAGERNISMDPGFVGNGDLSLKAGSPCIDKGDKSAVPAGASTDLGGNPRISGSSVDMGAYEYQQ